MFGFVPIFMAATMGMSGHPSYAPAGPQLIGFALEGAANYCIRNTATEFQVVARSNPAAAVVSVNRPFSSKPANGVMFQIYSLEQKPLENGGIRQVYTPVILSPCPA
ncbi:MAG: hypothetical protein JWO78_2103 [Micavibrio sp.]|nr:hypothetical protein [Micavibrio sp.]